ncbi:hypothetical protein [Thalassotalea mangrovi]|uniref:Uncharacterized protein n=1 Tax=Thalassotalea mangrovi TaxID=2572245 RepID=A0A4U1B295_9GAMM|nr:hypothetical protein [Thalassotalea mangrovi]TKB43633.1 hypothetical protein E8M12_14275 [Thalassotalea mangrovi]
MFINLTIIFAWLPALALLAAAVISLVNFLIGGLSGEPVKMASQSPLQAGIFIFWLFSVVCSFWAMCSVCFGLKMSFLWRLIALIIGTLAYLIPFAFFLPLIASFSLQGLMTVLLSLLALSALIHLIHVVLHIRLIIGADN